MYGTAYGRTVTVYCCAPAGRVADSNPSFVSSAAALYRETMKVLALAAAAALAARVGAEHTVWRPAEWGGPFRKDKDIKESTKVADSVFGHGIAQPHVLPCSHLGEHKLDGFECYRVYVVLDTKIAETMYAGTSVA
eukprot:COSAG02_NODE_20_length_53673_cov_86.864841_19_plen_136_part_00